MQIEKNFYFIFVSDLIFCILIWFIASNSLPEGDLEEIAIPIILSNLCTIIALTVMIAVNKKIKKKYGKQVFKDTPPGYMNLLLIIIIVKAFFVLVAFSLICNL